MAGEQKRSNRAVSRNERDKMCRDQAILMGAENAWSNVIFGPTARARMLLSK